MAKSKIKNLIIRLSPELHKKLKVKSAKDGISIQRMVLTVIEGLLK